MTCEKAKIIPMVRLNFDFEGRALFRQVACLGHFSSSDKQTALRITLLNSHSLFVF